jgi:hypothetical protein
MTTPPCLLSGHRHCACPLKFFEPSTVNANIISLLISIPKIHINIARMILHPNPFVPFLHDLSHSNCMAVVSSPHLICDICDSSVSMMQRDRLPGGQACASVRSKPPLHRCIRDQPGIGPHFDGARLESRSPPPDGFGRGEQHCRACQSAEKINRPGLVIVPPTGNSHAASLLGAYSDAEGGCSCGRSQSRRLFRKSHQPGRCMARQARRSSLSWSLYTSACICRRSHQHPSGTTMPNHRKAFSPSDNAIMYPIDA